MKKNKIFILFLVTVILTLGVSISLQSLLAAWTPPTAIPPSSNIPAPLNIGTVGQAKDSGLILNHLNVDANGLIVENGKVGIGILSPQSKLSVGGVGTTQASIYGAGAYYAVYGSSANIGIYGADGSIGVLGKGTTNGVRGESSSGVAVEGFGLSPSGVGVSGNSVNSYGVQGISTNNYGGSFNGKLAGVYAVGTNYDFYGAGTKTYFGGNVGVGVANPAYKLDVNGDLNFTGTLRNNGTPVVMGVAASGLYGYCAALKVVPAGGPCYGASTCVAGSISPASCALGTCSCSSGYTMVRTGQTNAVNVAFCSTYTEFYTCVKN